MPPTAITKPQHVGAITAFHLEQALVTFIRQLFTDTYLLDNPAVNFGQATGPAHPIVVDPDSVTPYDPTGRAQSLLGKVPPQVVRGRVPRTVTGEIDGTQLPDFPSIIVQAIEGKVEACETLVKVRIFLHSYDENPDSQGYQDLTNMIELMAYALTSYGQKGIDSRFPIVMPFEWHIPDSNAFPHFIGEMLTTWQLPSARPLPDPEDVFFLFQPAEHLDVRMSYPNTDYSRPEPPPYVPPPLPAGPRLIASWPVESQDDDGNSYGVFGSDAGPTDSMAMSAVYQSLLMPEDGKLSSIKLYLKVKYGVPFDVIVQLYAATGADGVRVPTGPVLATSDPILAADVVSKALNEFLFSGANQVQLVAGQLYAFVFTYLGAYPATGQSTYLGMNWAGTLADNCGFYQGYQGNWSPDDYGIFTFYLYAT